MKEQTEKREKTEYHDVLWSIKIVLFTRRQRDIRTIEAATYQSEAWSHKETETCTQHSRSERKFYI